MALGGCCVALGGGVVLGGGVSGAGGEGKWSRSRENRGDLRQKEMGPATGITDTRPAVAQVGGANGAGPGKTGGPAPKIGVTCDGNYKT